MAKKTKSALAPLSVEKLHKSYAEKKVLDDISLEVRSGEIFGLIGLNGAGKTTLIKIILGLLKQDKGSASIFGASAELPKTRAKLSYLPEKFYPSIYLKGTEFLSLSLAYYGKKFSKEAARSYAEMLDLNPDVLPHTITRYSKGMGQKLGLMGALLTENPLLILDEPMSGLDPRARILLKDALKSYVKGGKTIFFSSHILSDIDEICDRIAILHDRKMIFVGTPEAFKKKYKSSSLERSFLQAIDG